MLKHPVKLILLPVAAVVAAALITHVLQPPRSHPYYIFVFAILIVTILTEWRAGWLATFLSALTLDYFFCEPTGSLGIEDLSEGAQLAIFTVGCTLFSAVVGKWNVISSLVFSEASALLKPVVRRLAELERVEQSFEALLNGLEGFAAVLVAPNGNIEKCYKASEGLTGWPGPDVAGKPLQHLLPGLTSERLQEYFARAREQRRAEVVTECRHKTGTSRTLVLVLAPIYDIEEQPEVRDGLPYTVARDRMPAAYLALLRDLRESHPGPA